MGSLFRVREWWSHKVDDEQGFDRDSLVVCNIDNATDYEDKIIVGSLSGILRVYRSRIDAASSSGQQLLLEVDFGVPILAIASGRFLSSSDSSHLLVLHPCKVSVYSLSGTAGLSEHGTSHNILLIYEHLLNHSAYSVVVGPFGHVKGRDFICVQSLDGTLSFFEQETFTFRRVLPDHLLPAPFKYCSTSDSFIVVTSCRSLECYRYQIIAIAKESKNSKESSSSGRRIVADWSLTLGEAVTDLQVVPNEKHNHFIVAMGERNLFVVGEDGSLLFITKFDFCPVSMTAYMNGETLMTLIVTEFSTLLCFAHRSLKWAAQMSFPAISLRRATVSNIPGVIVALSDSGDLDSCYLGTNPSISLVSVPSEHQQIKYEDAEKELTELRKTIRAFGEDVSAGPVTPGRAAKSNLLHVQVQEVDSSDHDLRHGVESVAYEVILRAESPVHNIRLTIDVPQPLRSHKRQFMIDQIVPNTPSFLTVSVFCEGNFLPPSLTMNTTAVFFTDMQAPRICSANHQLSMKLISNLSALPSDDLGTSVPLHVVCSNPLRLLDLYPEFVGIDDNATEIGIESTANSDLASITMQFKATQCRITVRSVSIHFLSLVSLNLMKKIRSIGLRFDAALFDRKFLPMEPYCRLVDRHLNLEREIQELRHQLSGHAAHFRSVEKRFLVRLKDRNPASTADIENLIAFVMTKVTSTIDKIIDVNEKLSQTNAELAATTALVAQMVASATNMKHEQSHLLTALMNPFVNSTVEEGSEEWVATTEVALKDFSGPIRAEPLAMTDGPDLASKSSARLRPLLDKILASALKGEFGTCGKALTSGTPSVSPPPGASADRTSFLHPTTAVIPEEEEYEAEVEQTTDL